MKETIKNDENSVEILNNQLHGQPKCAMLGTLIIGIGIFNKSIRRD